MAGKEGSFDSICMRWFNENVSGIKTMMITFERENIALTSGKVELSAGQVETINSFIRNYSYLQNLQQGRSRSANGIISRVAILVNGLERLKAISDNLKEYKEGVLSVIADGKNVFLNQVKECHTVIRNTEKLIQLKQLLGQIEKITDSVDYGP